VLGVTYNQVPVFYSDAQLGGRYVVPFVNGVANFTRMRVDTPATDLQLSFTTSPGDLRGESNVTFSVTAPVNDAPGKLVTFKLAGNYQSVVTDYNSFLVAVKEHLGQQLDIDVSRITRLRVCDCVMSRGIMLHDHHRPMMVV